MRTAAKSFAIPKRQVYEAWKRVKANRGAAGIDKQSIAEFEEDLSGNLYKVWNRMASGSYFPPPVSARDIPKKSGGVRTLGIPTVGDRVAQTVVKLYLEPLLEPCFDEDSYGYRPNRSALDAVRVTRKRCWKYDWVLEFDVKGAFDHLGHDLLMKAVRKHTDCQWVLLYLERWLTAPSVTGDGELSRRGRGTPQGGVISPLLIPCQTPGTLAAFSAAYDAVLRGWWNYYGSFYPTALKPLFRHFDRALERWACRKFKRLGRHRRRSRRWLAQMARHESQLFVHWRARCAHG